MKERVKQEVCLGSINPKRLGWLLPSLVPEVRSRGTPGIPHMLASKGPGYEESLVPLTLQVGGGKYLHKLD